MRWKAACAYVEEHHRHHDPPQGHQFSLGVHTEGGCLVGVAIVGRPVNRHLDNRLTIEVTRVATDGTPNACSALYSAAWRTARSAGYRRAITYTQDGESGASLKAAGWRKIADLPARAGWNSPSRPRCTLGTENVARALWEITTHNAPPLSVPSDETRDKTRSTPSRKRCPECREPITAAATGRPARYCSPACRQRAYRKRTR
ncbi:XF1762 family protein [Streptomyces sp. Midd1]|uniref:XF1762 family protein n=1 Tax=Streptomyces sp. Midd3 TaxID=3161191 RepID=UPI0034DAEFFB